MLGVFNLLPGFPLDGGRILRATLWARSHNLQAATRVASQTGSTLAFILMAAGVAIALVGAFLSGIWLIVIGWFLRSQSEASYSQLVKKNILEGTPALAILEPDYHTVHPETTLDGLVNAYLLHYSQRYFPVSTVSSLDGLITITDLQRVPRREWHSKTVADAMTPADKLNTLAPDDSLGRAAELIAANDVNQLPVVVEGRLLGFVTRAGIMRMIQLREGAAANVEHGSAEGMSSERRIEQTESPAQVSTNSPADHALIRD